MRVLEMFAMIEFEVAIMFQNFESNNGFEVQEACI